MLKHKFLNVCFFSLKRISFCILIFGLCFVLSSGLAYAEDFATSYNVTYTFNSDGSTGISNDIKITNLTSDVYAADYTLSISNVEIDNIQATQDGRPLEVNVDEQEGLTRINVKFIREVVGEGRAFEWNLSYTSRNILTKRGAVWEVTIPRLNPGETLREYNITLLVPLSFGEHIYIYPRPVSVERGGEYSRYEFKDQESNIEGINAVFGEFQLFHLNLKYHLKNPTTGRVRQEIALPPDIKGRQNIVIKKLNPVPHFVYTDEDNNYMAEYILEAGQTLFIEFSAEAKILRDEGVSHQYASLTDLNEYLKEQSYWEYNNDHVREVIRGLNISDNDTNEEKARKIFDFVVNTLVYDDQKAAERQIERMGAEEALSNPRSAVCMEYTDTFIALARAVGVPAREINGYAYTAGLADRPLSLRVQGISDVLHSWPEYYSKERGWVQVDPTWSSTSGLDYFDQFDTNHITFVTHGIRSDYPYPAGSYKIDPSEDNFINVEYIETQTAPVEYKFSAAKRINTSFPEVLTLGTELEVRNIGNSTAYNVNINGVTVGHIPPYGMLVLSGEEFDNNVLSINFENFSGTGISSEVEVTSGIDYKNFILPLLTFLLALGLFLYMIFRS